MILIPLGFGRKLPRFPWLTLAISAVICLVSIPYFKKVSALETVRINARTQSGYVDKLVELSQTSCPAHGLGPDQCKAEEAILNIYLNQGLQGSERKVAETLEKLIIKDGDGDATQDSEDRVTETASDVVGLLKDPVEFDETIKNLPEYEPVNEAHAQMQRMIHDAQASDGFLSAGNRRFGPLMLAQFTHAGWEHLIGNLLVFILLASVLEMRMSALSFLSVYFVGGTLGLLVQTFFLDLSEAPLLGASANISAIIGAFFIYYFHRKMKLLLSLIFFNRLIDCATWLVVPALFVVEDIVGAMNGGGDVGHIAHLTGFMAGAGLALLFKKRESLHDSYLYPVEKDWHIQLRQAPDLRRKIAISENILKINPDNYLALEDTLHEAVDALRAQSAFPPDQVALEFIRKNLCAAMALAIHRRDVVRIETLLDGFPIHLSLIEMLGGVGQQSLILMSERQLKIGNWFLAIRLYDQFRYRFPNTSGAKAMAVSARQVLSHLQSEGSDLSILAEYLKFEKKTTFVDLLIEFAPHTNEETYERAS